jgi:hypothetical protein
LTVNRSDNLLRTIFSANGSAITTIVSTQEVPLDEWVHVRTVRSAGEIYQFINGALDGTGTFAAAMHDNIGEGLEWIIGGHSSTIGTANAGFYGWIDELVIFGEALGTTSFTPPTAPWPNPLP